MTSSRLYGYLLLTIAFLIALAASPAHAFGDDWKPVDPADLALKAPVVEKDADAEALFWEVRVADDAEGGTPRTVLRHYVRIKIFTERGRESQSKIDIPFFRGTQIKDIAARTIKPDGHIVELKKDDVFERTIVRVSGLKLKAKSFAMPSVEPGAIIEYRWREIRGDTLANYIRLQFQRDIPVQLVKYCIKPLSLPGFPFGMRTQFFHGQNTPFVKEKDGFYSTTMANVPAFHEEPRMPPEDQMRPWMLVYYSEDKKLSPEKYWKEYGKEVYSAYKSGMKVNDEVRKTVAEAIGEATTPEQKLQRLYEFCRAKIKNIDNRSSGITAADRAKLKENKTPADTLKRGMGSGKDIDLLFAALATAAGFDARVANLADRSDIFFDPSFPDSYFLRAYDIAVRVGDQWRFFDPGSTYGPYGMLLWQEEGQQALISDPKEPVWTQTPLSPPEKSQEKRTAKLSLSEDGTLEGDVRVEYTGHLAAQRKEQGDDESDDQREQTLRDQIKRQMSAAELSNIRIENATDPEKPLVYSYHARVPGYAQRTGKRLFIQPAFFQWGAGALFPTSDRKYPIYFHHPWSENDTVTIDLPAGFALDHADAPNPLSAGELSKYDVKIQIADNHTLIYRRTFFFGGKDVVLFSTKVYPTLKQFFDMIHERDNHTIALKQNTVASK